MVESKQFLKLSKLGQAWCLTVHGNNEVSSLLLQVFDLLGTWSWHVNSPHVFLAPYLGQPNVSKPGPSLSVLQSS